MGALVRAVDGCNTATTGINSRYTPDRGTLTTSLDLNGKINTLHTWYCT